MIYILNLINFDFFSFKTSFVDVVTPLNWQKWQQKEKLIK
jgi:hypothetical protein